MELPEPENLPRVASEKQHGTESENTCNFPIFDTFGCYVWKDIVPEASNPGTPTLDLELWRVIRTAHARPIIPVVQIYITYSTIDLLCIIWFSLVSFYTSVFLLNHTHLSLASSFSHSCSSHSPPLHCLPGRASCEVSLLCSQCFWHQLVHQW